MTDPKYRLIIFKIEGHEKWRLTTEKSIKQVKGVTHAKMLEIDRNTGQIKLFKMTGTMKQNENI